MSNPTVTRAFAHSFEPILIFHPDEQFFPVDPKWYVERSALWRIEGKPFADKNNWGEPPRTRFPRLPMVDRNNLAALQSEAGGKTWIGEPGLGVALLPEGQTDPNDERFLDFGGWEPPLAPTAAVTASSTNRYAALDPAEYAGPLSGSRPWYYAEHLDNADLRTFTLNRKPNGLDLFSLVANDSDTLSFPQALVYHFLYPVHEEALEGCEDTGDATRFASFAGEWGAVAILLNSANRPTYIGLTSRNIGDPSIVGAEEQRVGMTVLPWSAVDRVKTPSGEHPKLYVSKGTHGYYVSPGPHVLTGFTPGADSSGLSCGQVETADDAISSEEVLIPGDPGKSTSTAVLVLKLISLILTPWAIIEITSDRLPTAEELASPDQPTDQTAGPGTGFGTIIRPDHLAFNETSEAAAVIDWNVQPYTAKDGRSYDLAIDRSVQAWWNPRIETPGFGGRWGPRVTNDPFSRRGGMKCPDFLTMFLEGMAVQMVKK